MLKYLSYIYFDVIRILDVLELRKIFEKDDIKLLILLLHKMNYSFNDLKMLSYFFSRLKQTLWFVIVKL